MTITHLQKKIVWLSVLFTPLCVAVALTLVPFLFVNAMFESANASLLELMAMYKKQDMHLPNGVALISYNDFLMKEIKVAVGGIPIRIAISYLIFTIPIAIFAFLYSFIYMENQSILLMVSIWLAAAAILSLVLNKLYFTDRVLISDAYMGQLLD